LISADNPQRTTADEIWRPAGFDGRDARATILKTHLLNCGPFRSGHGFRERGGFAFMKKRGRVPQAGDGAARFTATPKALIRSATLPKFNPRRR